MAVLAILGVAGGFVGPAIEVVKWISAPVRRQFNYLCCFRSNINTLKDEARNLEDKTRGLQMKVDAATNNAQRIFPQVETWLRDSDEMKNRVTGIFDRTPNVESGCLKVGERYSLSKKAKKTTRAIKELVERCMFSDIFYPPPIAASVPVQSGTTTYEFESRRQIEEEIIQTLDSKKVHMIGICGMGGLGKTTMAEKIMSRALKEGFSEVVKVVVSQPVDKLNIQLQIAEALGLKFEGDTLIPRANILQERLRGNKRILLVLDDLWESLDIKELGILCEYGCKVLLTSRDKDVFKAMDVEKVCKLKILDEKEAWVLFKVIAGTCVNDVVLNTIAKDVMRECKGLPIALFTVGIALKDEDHITIWEDALGQLRRSNPTDIPNIIEKVYKPLKLSYDALDSKNAKSMFLLCCLFPEDYNILLEHLTYFAIGLRLFEDIGELTEVKGRTSALIKMLKTRGLLLDGHNEAYVRMHDVVRDVSIFIASRERRLKCNDCTWISSHVDGGGRVVPPQSFFPNLKLLWMNNKIEQEMEISDNLIRRSTELNVLFIKYNLLKSLPELCTSVVALVLYNCASLESIAAVGQLKSLEILVCASCDSIKDLPEQVRGLNRLKLLKISFCYKLKRVAKGVISSMVALEELKIVKSFKNWKGGEIHEEGKEASLRELESLKKLRCLEIEVSDIALAAQPLRFSPEVLVQFRIRFGKDRHDHEALPKMGYQRRVSFDLKCVKEFNVGDLSTDILLTRTECLSASGDNQDFNLVLATCQSIRWLSLRGFRNIKNITSANAVFPFLECLSLDYLCKLEEIWDDAPILSNSFNNLKHLKLDHMRALKRLGKCTLSTTNDFFLQLETIHIKSCSKMEHLVLVSNEEEQGNEDEITLLFPKLKLLCLCNLQKLKTICSRGIESIRFPLLAQMEIMGCGNLRCLVSRDDDDHYKDDDDDSSHLFCHPKVSFSNLERLTLEGNVKSKNVWCDQVPIGFFTRLVELHVSYYSKIRRLFSLSSKIPQNLVNLQKLKIERCLESVKVVEDDEEVSSLCDHPTKHTSTPLFPSLQVIQLSNLPKLESFCEWRCALELHSLKILGIKKCDEMKSFNAGAGSLVVTPALQILEIDDEELECVDGLNAALHQHFEKAKRKRKKKMEKLKDNN